MDCEIFIVIPILLLLKYKSFLHIELFALKRHARIVRSSCFDSSPTLSRYTLIYVKKGWKYIYNFRFFTVESISNCKVCNFKIFVFITKLKLWDKINIYVIWSKWRPYFYIYITVRNVGTLKQFAAPLSTRVVSAEFDMLLENTISGEWCIRRHHLAVAGLTLRYTLDKIEFCSSFKKNWEAENY